MSELNSDYQRRNSSAASVHCRSAVLQFGTIAKLRVLAVLHCCAKRTVRGWIVADFVSSPRAAAPWPSSARRSGSRWPSRWTSSGVCVAVRCNGCMTCSGCCSDCNALTVQRCRIASQPNRPPIIALQRLPASARRAASSSGGPRRGLRECCAERAAFSLRGSLALPQLGMPRAMFVALAEDEAELEPICANLCGSAVSLFKRE